MGGGPAAGWAGVWLSCWQCQGTRACEQHLRGERAAARDRCAAATENTAAACVRCTRHTYELKAAHTLILLLKPSVVCQHRAKGMLDSHTYFAGVGACSGGFFQKGFNSPVGVQAAVTAALHRAPPGDGKLCETTEASSRSSLEWSGEGHKSGRLCHPALLVSC